MYSPKSQATTAKHKHVAASSSSSNSSEECDVIGQLMGQYGKYQFMMTFLLSLFQVPNTFHIASSIYQVIELPGPFRRCLKKYHKFIRQPIKRSGVADRCIWWTRAWRIGVAGADRRITVVFETSTGGMLVPAVYRWVWWKPSTILHNKKHNFWGIKYFEYILQVWTPFSKLFLKTYW